MAVKINGFIEGTQPEELLKLLISLASNWGDVIDVSKLKVAHLSGAMTNVVYRVTWPRKDAENDERTVLVRIYGEGSSVFFNREEEIRIFESISALEHGPRLLAQFPQGRVEEFIHAKTLSARDIRDPKISALIATKMRDFHNLDIPGSKDVLLWPRLRNWLIKARSLCSPEHAKEFRLDTLENEIELLEKALSQCHQNVGFCHNDLQYGNIMMSESTKAITIIDYEYASYNPVAYDVANHFCEWAANYHTHTPHVLDYDMYPDLEEQRRFVESYLGYPGNEASDVEVKQLIDDVDKFTLPNHLFWGLWGIISGYVNDIDFNYMEYAKQRFRQYWLRRPQLLKGKIVISHVAEKLNESTSQNKKTNEIVAGVA